MQTSLYFQNYQSFDGTPHQSHESQKLSACLHGSERVTIMHSKNTDRHSHKEVGENKQSAKESPLPQASNFRGI